MPIAASSSAQAPKTVISHMLNCWRDVDRDTTSSIVRTSDTGSPLACRSCSWTASLSDLRLDLRAHDPRHRRQIRR